jgi:hypothetical protein
MIVKIIYDGENHQFTGPFFTEGQAEAWYNLEIATSADDVYKKVIESGAITLVDLESPFRFNETYKIEDVPSGSMLFVSIHSTAGSRENSSMFADMSYDIQQNIWDYPTIEVSVLQREGDWEVERTATERS